MNAEAYSSRSSLTIGGQLCFRVIIIGVALTCWNTYVTFMSAKQLFSSSSLSQTKPKSRRENISQPLVGLENNAPLSEFLASTPPIYPINALEKYKLVHSAQILRKESSLENRHFAIIYWWCPDRAGNILHNFFNNLLWAIITNRTALWIYDESSGSDYESCANALTINDWIPSFAEFESRLPFDISDIVPIPINADRWRYDNLHSAVLFPQLADILSSDNRIARCEWNHHPMAPIKLYRRYLKALPKFQKKVAAMLYSETIDFLLGMLFRICFTIRTFNIEDSNTVSTVHSSSMVYSIALHSRHPVIGDDGSYVEDEKRCLDKIVRLYRNSSEYHEKLFPKCKVYLLSDRPTTLLLLSQHVVSLGCQPVLTCERNLSNSNDNIISTSNSSHHHISKVKANRMDRTEHGPRAGAGFLEDLVMAGQARNAIIGDPCRSSFALLKELISYDRSIENKRRLKSHIILDEESKDELQLCSLPNKQTIGYNYGPGTPTFTHHTRMQPLSPIKLLQAYKKKHAVSTIKDSSFHNRRFLVKHFSSTESSIYTLIDGFLLSILTNRTMVVIHASSDEDVNDDDADNAIKGNHVLSPVTTWMPTRDLMNKIIDHLTAMENLSERESFGINEALTRAKPLNGNHDLNWTETLLSASSVLTFPDSDFPPLVSLGTFLASAGNAARGILDVNSYKRWVTLTTEGIPFLYGMLFHAAIEYSPSVRQYQVDRSLPETLLSPSGDNSNRSKSNINISSANASILVNHNQVQTIAIDARQQPWSTLFFSDDRHHPNELHSKEMTCLESIIGSSMPCHLLLLTKDRISITDHSTSNSSISLPPALESCLFTILPSSVMPLRKHDEKQTMNDTTVSYGGKDADMLVSMGWIAARTREAYIGSKSSLLRYLITYQRRIEIWHYGRDPPIHPIHLPSCLS